MSDPEPFEVSEARIKFGDSSWTGMKDPKPFLNLTLEEALVLYKLLEHQYISYDNSAAHVVVTRLSKFIWEEQEKQENSHGNRKSVEP